MRVNMARRCADDADIADRVIREARVSASYLKMKQLGKPVFQILRMPVTKV